MFALSGKSRRLHTLRSGIVAAAVLACAYTTPVAFAAKAEQVNDTAHLKLVSSNGNTMVEAGPASGTLPGSVRITLTIHNVTASSSFTVSAKGGTISGRGQGKIKIGKGGYYSFGGSLHVEHGTGRYAKASGSGGLYGTIDRAEPDEKMTVQVTGTLHF